MDQVDASSDEVKNLIKSGQFWSLQVFSLEWEYLVKGIITDYIERPKKLGPHALYVIPALEGTMYLLNKSLVPDDAICARLGIRKSAVDKTDIIRLRPLMDESSLPEPTVVGWGRA